VNVTSALNLTMTLLWGGVTAVVMYVGASRIITRELTLASTSPSRCCSSSS